MEIMSANAVVALVSLLAALQRLSVLITLLARWFGIAFSTCFHAAVLALLAIAKMWEVTRRHRDDRYIQTPSTA
jgi:hypothetical protein